MWEIHGFEKEVSKVAVVRMLKSKLRWDVIIEEEGITREVGGRAYKVFRAKAREGEEPTERSLKAGVSQDGSRRTIVINPIASKQDKAEEKRKADEEKKKEPRLPPLDKGKGKGVGKGAKGGAVTWSDVVRNDAPRKTLAEMERTRGEEEDKETGPWETSYGKGVKQLVAMWDGQKGESGQNLYGSSNNAQEPEKEHFSQGRSGGGPPTRPCSSPMVVDDDEGKEKEEDEAYINKRRRQDSKEKEVPAEKEEREEEPQKKKSDEEQGARIEKLENSFEQMQSSLKRMEAMMMMALGGKKQEGGEEE
jgi:hypothetical protein